MNTLVELLKETSLLIIGLFVFLLILKLFFKHTLLGKIIAVIVIDTLLFIKCCFRITRSTGKYIYKQGKIINKKLKKKEVKSKFKIKNKKVVNGNVIDFETAKKLRHKWNK